MTKFVFIGDGDNDPDEIELYGHTFTLGGPAVEVTDLVYAKKLRGNANFREGEEAAPAPKKLKLKLPTKRPIKVEQIELPDED